MRSRMPSEFVRCCFHGRRYPVAVWCPKFKKPSAKPSWLISFGMVCCLKAKNNPPWYHGVNKVAKLIWTLAEMLNQQGQTLFDSLRHKLQEVNCGTRFLFPKAVCSCKSRGWVMHLPSRQMTRNTGKALNQWPRLQRSDGQILTHPWTLQELQLMEKIECVWSAAQLGSKRYAWAQG